ncbi:unnamed protein product [Pedinophyceae sp. YPF-701]|nr:unnamed protein product [Pedinophyceae sp. YPF-701]
MQGWRPQVAETSRWKAPVGFVTTPSGMPSSDSVDLDPRERQVVKLFEDTRESVVNVTQLKTVQDRLSLDIFNIPAGSGSGFVWNKGGNIVTNYHVVRGGSQLRVTLLDQTSYPAEVVGVDPSKDIAVIRIKAPQDVLDRLKPLEVGRSSSLLVGQSVYALGNPFALDHSLTGGIVSGLGREINGAGAMPIRGAIQTDAAINPGNSGGPLLDSKGRLIGVNTAILSGTGSYAGVGFAIPSDTVKPVVEQLLKYGQVMRPSLGIRVAPDEALKAIGLRGVLPIDVPTGSPAARAGMQATVRDRSSGGLILGDVIVAVDGKEVQTIGDLYDVLDGCRAGQEVRVTVLRGAARGPGAGKQVELKVKLEERGTSGGSMFVE